MKYIYKTPLLVAAESGNIEIFTLLLNFKDILIGDGELSGCAKLTQISIPLTIRSIGEGSFSQCSNLLQITLPTTMTKIGSYSFYFCKCASFMYHKKFITYKILVII